MTIPDERSRSVLQTRGFLEELMLDTELPSRVRNQAKALLRHFPETHNIEAVKRLEEACLGHIRDEKKRDLILAMHSPVFSDGRGGGS